VLYGSENPEKIPYAWTHKGDEKEEVYAVLKQTNGNKTKAAKILGITRTGLYKKMKRLEV
jgi:transcriptional regulator of acetoin/glycerol metabolism